MDILKWKFKPLEKSESGYDDIWHLLENYTKEKYDSFNDEAKNHMIEEVFNIYRNRNRLPITYYNEEGILEEIKKCRDKELPTFDGFVLDKRPTQGTSLLKYLFPNIQKVVCKGVENNSVLDRFNDDHKLKRAIKFCFEHKPKVKTPVVPTQLKDGLEMIGGNIPTNFLPMKTRMIVDYFMNEGETFLDFSCGFGGRMLGVLSSKKNLNYIGFEPSAETYYNLRQLDHYIYEAYQESTSRAWLLNEGSEIKLDKAFKEKVDFCFSSPPYFNLEKYSNEETQCYNKYPILSDWLEGYVRNTIKNIYFALKPNKYYAVNINDFKVNNQEIEFVKDWIRISEEEGFKLKRAIPNKLGKERINNKSEFGSYTSKEENIYLFKKI